MFANATKKVILGKIEIQSNKIINTKFQKKTHEKNWAATLK